MRFFQNEGIANNRAQGERSREEAETAASAASDSPEPSGQELADPPAIVEKRGQRIFGIISLASDSPEPLDRELADPPAIMGKRGRRILWMIGLLALGLRLILTPIGHAWDLTIDYNVFIDLAHNHSPYDTFNYLMHMSQSALWGNVYEYYAYPPIPLYIYYPLAKLYILLHPHATYFIAVPGTYAVPNLTIDFFFLFKLPIWIADFLIAALLARMSGTIRGFKDYLLNPYVLLISGAWTFDAVMVLGMVAAVYALYRGKIVWSAIALAFGTMVKFFPIIALPTILLYLIKKNRPFREIALYVGVYAVACLAFLGPFAGGVIQVLLFHDGRVGGGMNWQYLWNAWALYSDTSRLGTTLDTFAVFGTPALGIAMLLSYWWMWKQDMTLNRMMIVTLGGFFVGSKLINEQYALMLVPFLWLEAYRLKGAWVWFYRLFWMVPLGFTIFHVPIDRFFWLLYHMLFKASANITILDGTTGFEWTMIPWKHPAYGQAIALVLAFSFFFLSFALVVWPVRPIRRLKRSLTRNGGDGIARTGTQTSPPEDVKEARSGEIPEGTPALFGE